MIPVPQINVPETAGRVLITGRRLNELLRALRARTPLDATRQAAEAVQMPPVPLPRYQPGTTYLLPRSFIRRLSDAAAGRGLPPSEPQTAGAPAQIADTSAGLFALLDTLRSITPRLPGATGPLGYRLASAPPGVARLEWELEISAGYAVICAIGTSLLSPGNWVVGQETQVNTTLAGGWVDTATASGIISAYGPGESPDACEEPVYSSTFDPEVDYGDFLDSEFTETLVPFTDLIPPAIAALAPLSATEGAQEWPEASWQAVSEGTPYSTVLGSVAATSGADAPAQAISTRFRLRNRGGCAIRVDCGFYGSGLSGGATDDERNMTLPRGTTSDWIEPPAIDPDPDKGRIAAIRRVRLSRWLRTA